MSHYLVAQDDTNLVVNHSFEEHNGCPQNMFSEGNSLKLDELNNWYLASRGTTDYFQSCSDPGMCGVPENMWGYQHARTGNSYIGINTTGGGISSKNYREYAQSELKDTLTRGQKYYAEFYVSLAEISSYSTNTLGIHVSREKIQGHRLNVIGYDTRKKAERRLKRQQFYRMLAFNFRRDTFYRLEYLAIEPVVPQMKMNEFIADTINWVKVSGTFVAEGGEKYLTIGSFEKTRKRKKHGRNRNKVRLRSNFVTRKHGRNIFLTRLSKSAYYYVDDVLLKPVYDEPDSALTVDDPVENPHDLESILIADGHFTLKNLHFDTDKYIIREESYSHLDSLVAFLQKHPEIKIEIAGHTDNAGTVQHNLELSLNRALAVKTYLVDHEIDATRLQAKGYGQMHPIVPNDSEEHRQLNRRVEIVIVD